MFLRFEHVDDHKTQIWWSIFSSQYTFLTVSLPAWIYYDNLYQNFQALRDGKIVEDKNIPIIGEFFLQKETKEKNKNVTMSCG